MQSKLLLVVVSLWIGLASAFGDTGGYIDAARGASLESCIQGKLRAVGTSVESLKPGQTWACVTLSYFWDEQDHATRFVENYSRGNYRFESATLEHGNESLLYVRNVLDAANPVDFTLFATAAQTGAREDVRLGLEHTIDFVVADPSGAYLFVERSLRNTEWNLRWRPSLAESPYAWLDRPAASEYENSTGRSMPELYRRVTQYMGCYLAARPETKAQVPCFGDLDRKL